MTAASLGGPTPIGGDAGVPGAHRRILSWSKVYWLFWLRTKLLLRGYSRDWRRVVGAVLLLLIAVPFLGGIALATLAGYVFRPRSEAIELLMLVLVGLYLFWSFLPLIEFGVNEGLDVTKLTLYPLTRLERMVSLLLATLLDIPTLGIVALFSVILLGWSRPAATLVIMVPALLVAYIHIVGLSQLVLACFMGLLRSRRYRDMSIILFALFGSACSIGQQVVARSLAGFDFRHGDPFASVHLAQYLQFAPPGMAGRAIVLASQGEWWQALGWLAMSALLTIPLLWLWMVALERGISMAESGGGSGSRPRRTVPAQQAALPARAARPQAAAQGMASSPVPPASAALPAQGGLAQPAVSTRRSLSELLPLPVQAMFRKDLYYFWRDPQMKASMLSSLFILIVIFVGPAFGTGSTTHARPWTVLISCLAPLFLTMNLSLNSLGLERQALSTLFLFPARPLYILWGKNLAVAVVAMGEQLLIAAAFSILTGAWQFYLPAVIVGLAAIAVMLGCGNVASVLLPFRAAQMRMGSSSSGSPESGCLRLLMGTLSITITLIILSPVIVGIAVPVAANHLSLLAITLPLALVYGLAIYQGTSWFIAPRLLRRMPEILAVTMRE
jgi:ABC-2 type transport system permease protein